MEEFFCKASCSGVIIQTSGKNKTQISFQKSYRIRRKQIMKKLDEDDYVAKAMLATKFLFQSSDEFEET